MILAAFLIALVLVLPGPPVLPVEMFVMLALRPLRSLWLTLLLAMVLVRIGDAGMMAAYGRPFDLVTDWGLLPAAWDLIGPKLALLVPILLVLAFGLNVALRRRAPWPLLALVLVLPLDAPLVRLAVAKTAEVSRTLADLHEFRLAARIDPWDGAALSALQGRAAAIIFVESYGRASFDNPRYADHASILRGAEADIRAAGLAMRSGWLTSPVAGGQSWLAHGTLFSGLRVADQGRYRALLQSPRRTLFDLAGQAGLHPLAVMPGITMDWPEGAQLGFAEILDAKTMGYRGKGLGWVTMPDQYTLSVLERRLAPDVFAGVALVSSHAPWVPVIGAEDWDRIGDGSVFDGRGWDTRTPEQVWSNQDTIREQYRLSLAYSLRMATEFAARQGENPPLLVILGDHQPAGFVAEDDSRDVPVHVIGPPDLIRRLDGWGFADGLIPVADFSAWPMEAFRDRYLGAFTDEADIED